MVSFEVQVDDELVVRFFEEKSSKMGPEFVHLIYSMLKGIQREVVFVSPHKTGRFKRSIQYVLQGDGGKVYTQPAIAPHNDWVINGRGIVTPKRKKALHFFYYGREVFAKRVKPTKPNPVFDKAAPAAERVVSKEMDKFLEWLEA